MLEILYFIVAIAILPVFIWGIVVQVRVNSTFKKFSTVSSRSGTTGSDVAKRMLESAGIENVNVLQGKGHLSDHYDPKRKEIKLSAAVFGSTSVSSIGVAAHEAGHAIQHKEGYLPMKIRAALVPFVNIGSWMFLPLFILGVIMIVLGNIVGITVIYVAIGLYGLSTLFYLVTLPVELDASKRALNQLEQLGILNDEELSYAKKVLRAAAMTYIVAFLMSLLQLMRFVLWALLSFSRRK